MIRLLSFATIFTTSTAVALSDAQPLGICFIVPIICG